MATEPRSAADEATGQASHEASTWRRVLAWVKAFGEAMDTSSDAILDRRILALERDVAALSAQFRAFHLSDKHIASRDWNAP